MGKRLLTLATVLFAGCSEYNLENPPIAFGEVNPPTVESPVNTDKIVQVTTPAVDVLWVVDNSGSMSDNQTALANNFPSFMDYFLGSGLDYHIGVVATDMQSNAFSGKLREWDSERYITTETSDPNASFAVMAQIGSGGSSDERGREAAYTAMELLKDTYNVGFMRDEEESGVHVVIISDENDKSNNSPISNPEFIAYLNDLRGDDELVTFNSICNPPGGGLINEPGTDYIDVTNGVGGIMHDIKNGDWVAVLEALGIQAAGLKREYFLSHLPVVDTLEVWVVVEDGTVLPFSAGADYEYTSSRNSITFESYIPDPLAEVFIEYTILASAVETVEYE